MSGYLSGDIGNVKVASDYLAHLEDIHTFHHLYNWTFENLNIRTTEHLDISNSNSWTFEHLGIWLCLRHESSETNPLTGLTP